MVFGLRPTKATPLMRLELAKTCGGRAGVVVVLLERVGGAAGGGTQLAARAKFCVRC